MVEDVEMAQAWTSKDLAIRRQNHCRTIVSAIYENNHRRIQRDRRAEDGRPVISASRQYESSVSSLCQNIVTEYPHLHSIKPFPPTVNSIIIIYMHLPYAQKMASHCKTACSKTRDDTYSSLLRHCLRVRELKSRNQAPRLLPPLPLEPTRISFLRVQCPSQRLVLRLIYSIISSSRSKKVSANNVKTQKKVPCCFFGSCLCRVGVSPTLFKATPLFSLTKCICRWTRRT